MMFSPESTRTLLRWACHALSTFVGASPKMRALHAFRCLATTSSASERQSPGLLTMA